MPNENTSVVEKKKWETGCIEALAPYKASFPPTLNLDRSVANLYYAVTTMPNGGHYPAASIVNCAKTAFTLGLDFLNKEAYLVPYGNTLQCQISYKGSTKLAKLHSVRPIQDIQAYILREGDQFQMWQENGETKYTYKPKSCNDGKIVGAFCVVLYKDGGLFIDQMNRKELDAAKSASKAQNSPAWKSFPEEMFRKCCVKRCVKKIDIEWDNAEQMMAWQEDGAIKTQETVKVEKAPFDDDNVIDGNGVVTDA